MNAPNLHTGNKTEIQLVKSPDLFLVPATVYKTSSKMADPTEPKKDQQNSREDKRDHLISESGDASHNAEKSDIEAKGDQSAPSSSPAPDGGREAWLVAAGGSSLFFCCLGFSNSFGVFAEYYLSHQLVNKSPDDVAWIGSLSVFIQFATGMLGGPMFDRFGAWMIRPAAVSYVFALMMLSLCREYWHFMLVQGVLIGIAMGLLQFPAFAAVSQYFDAKRAAALGVVVSGSSIGGVVIPILVSKTLNDTNLGFGWSVRIVAFLIIPIMTFACITIKARLPPRTAKFWIMAAYKETTFIMFIMALFFMFVGMFTPLFYISVYAVSRGMSPALAGYLLAVLNAASTLGRIIPGILADKYGRLNTFATGGIATGIVVFCMNSAITNAQLIGYTFAFGFVSGTIISGASAAFSLCPKDPRDMGTYMGMGMSSGALGGLIGPPVNGVFLRHYEGFFELSMFSGAMCLTGGIIALLTKLTKPEGIFGRT